MIVSKQAQQEQAKVSAPAAQAQLTPVQSGKDAFGVLLALLAKADGVNSDAELSVDLSSDVTTENQALENLSADQATAAAKFADWLAANPASLAALNALAGSASGSMPSNFAAAWSGLSAASQSHPEQASALQSLDALAQPNGDMANHLARLALARALGSDASALVASDATAKSSDFLASLESAGDSQSLAAALMAAIGSGSLGSSAETTKKSSNQLLTNSIYGELSLADVLSQMMERSPIQASDGGVTSKTSLPFAGAETLGRPNEILAAMGDDSMGEASLSAILKGLPTDSAPEQPRRTAATLADAPRNENLLANAAMQAARVETGPDFAGVQHAISAQALGHVAFANASSLEGAVSWLSSHRGGSATIDLTPPELGSVRLELKVDAAGENASLVVHAASDAARAAIEQSLERLYESFQASGMSLQVSVGGGSLGYAQNFANGLNSGSSQDMNELGAKDGRLEAAPVRRLPNTQASDALSLYA